MLIGFREKEEAGGLDTFKRKWEIKSVKKETLTPSEVSGIQVTWDMSGDHLEGKDLIAVFCSFLCI